MSVLENIQNVIISTKDFSAAKDLLLVAREDKKALANKNALLWLARFCEDQIAHGCNVERYYYLHEEVLKECAIFDFESYMLFTEWNRPLDRQFYRPRRKQLKVVASALQDIEDTDLELLAVSMPPGVGKSTIALFYLTWLAGKYPDLSCLTGSHKAEFVQGCYEECLSLMSPTGEYRWHDVFNVPLVKTDAKALRIDLGSRQPRRETLQYTTINSGNAGLFRATKILYCDDLVAGSEVALNKDQLDKLWTSYSTDLVQRKLNTPEMPCKEIHIATRWSVFDIIGRLQNHYANSDKARFIVMPAWDENEESLFDYKYAPGYTTEQLHKIHDTMSDVDWNALYMNQPVEREGLLYPKEELRYYYELPKEEPDTIMAVCDTKDAGKDYAFMPIVYVYGEDYYIEDCICDNGLPKVVDVRLANILLKHKVKACRFESNAAGGKTAEKVQEMLKKSNGITHITTKYTTSNKITKIIQNSDWVMKHCLFKSRDCYKANSDYGRMMNFLSVFTMSGKNAHDDVPDGLAQLAVFAQSFGTNVKIFQRPW